MSEKDLNQSLNELLQDNPENYPSTWQNLITGFRARRTAEARAAQRDALREQIEMKLDQLEGFANLKRATQQIKEQEREARFQEVVYNAPADVKVQLLTKALEADRIETERQKVRSERMSWEAGFAPAIQRREQFGIDAAQPFVLPEANELDERSIKALAAKGVYAVASKPPGEQSGELAAWLQNLRAYLPAHTMELVEAEVDELRSLIAGG